MREPMEEETNLKKVVREAGKGLMDLLLCSTVKPSGPSHHVLSQYKDMHVYHCKHRLVGKMHARMS